MQKVDPRPFRITLTIVLILALVAFAFSVVAGTTVVKNGVSVTDNNLNGLEDLVPGVLVYIAVGVITLIAAMYFTGRLLGQNWRANIKAIVDHSFNDSAFNLAKNIAMAAVFVAVSVAPGAWYTWILVFAVKFVVMLAVSIVVSGLLCWIIMAANNDPQYHWYQLDQWWLDNMANDGSDMVSGLTGFAFQLVGWSIFGTWLVPHLL